MYLSTSLSSLLFFFLLHDVVYFKGKPHRTRLAGVGFKMAAQMASSAMEKVSEKVSFAKKVLISFKEKFSNYLLIIWSIHCFRVAITLVWALELGIETIRIFLINIFFMYRFHCWWKPLQTIIIQLLVTCIRKLLVSCEPN